MRHPSLQLVHGTLAERAIADRERLFRQAEARRLHDALEAEIWADRSEEYPSKPGIGYLGLLIAVALFAGVTGGAFGFGLGRLAGG